MNRESVELGFILKNIPDYDFSMTHFDERLKLQKLIYLLQAFGVYLGYDFSWYLRGPYCSLLAHNGFSLEEIYDKIPKDIKLKDKEDQKKFYRFQNFVKAKTVDDLEIAASIHYLKNVRGKSMDDERIKEKVSKKQDRFTIEQVGEIWRDLKNLRII